MNDSPRAWLDFAVIGALKSGTTSLFQHLSAHPEISLPASKEAPYFSDDDLFALGPEQFADLLLPRRRPGMLLGTVSPQYMMDPLAPPRILEALPGVKLIAILRHPIGRAASQYAMARRTGLEERKFEQAIAEQLEADSIDRARLMRRGNESFPNTYAAWSEYGRILSTYFGLFGAGAICVVFLDDLERNPADVLERIFGFLGVDPNFRPSNLERRHHRGGFETRTDVTKRLARVPPLRAVWRSLPQRWRHAVAFRWMARNVVPAETSTVVTPATRDALLPLFTADVARLERLIGCRVPWPDLRA